MIAELLNQESYCVTAEPLIQQYCVKAELLNQESYCVTAEPRIQKTYSVTAKLLGGETRKGLYQALFLLKRKSLCLWVDEDFIRVFFYLFQLSECLNNVDLGPLQTISKFATACRVWDHQSHTCRFPASSDMIGRNNYEAKESETPRTCRFEAIRCNIWI